MGTGSVKNTVKRLLSPFPFLYSHASLSYKRLKSTGEALRWRVAVLRSRFSPLPPPATADNSNSCVAVPDPQKPEVKIITTLEELDAQLGSAELPLILDGEPNFDKPVSQLVTVAQICSARFEQWRRLFQWGFGLNRKLWEYLYILNGCDSYGGLGAGRRALGFGVGHERLAALLANMGCQVMATDYVPGDGQSLGWEARSLEDLMDELVCPEEKFRQNVSFRHVDMNEIPSDLLSGQFDFLWSCGSLEHIGGLQNGLDFIEKAMACLRPGGVAVHTTEFNVVSNERTLDTPGLSFYRRQDIQGLAQRLREQGHHIALNFTKGTTVADLHVDQEPYHYPLSINALVGEFVITSIGLIIQKGWGGACGSASNVRAGRR